MKTNILNLVILALLCALVTVATMLISIPVPATNGYINMGDSIIFLVAIIFGKKKGAIAGGFGSALADLLLGYSQWIIPTLIVKGLMGYIVGYIANQNDERVLIPRNILALAIGALWMAGGYYVAYIVFFGSWQAGLAGLPGDIFQGFAGAAVFIPIGIAFKKVKFFRRYAINND